VTLIKRKGKLGVLDNAKEATFVKYIFKMKRIGISSL
jgi:hypothetical protein